MLNIDNEKIFFLISYPRSGNTWMTLILKDLFEAQLSEIGNVRLTGKELDFGQFQTLLYGTSEDTLFGDNKSYDYENDLLCIKTHNRFDQEYPFNNKFIYLIRDPRDVMLSYYFHQHMKLKNQLKDFDPKEFQDFLEKHLHQWKKHIEIWTQRDGLFIKYEDLKSEPKKTLQTIAEYLDVDTLDRLDTIIEKHVTNPEYMTNQNDKFFRKGIVGDYQNYYTQEHLNYLQESASSILKKFNY